MTVLSAQTIRALGLVRPCVDAAKDPKGNSYGLSACGYDVRLDQDLTILGKEFQLASAMEYFEIPANVVGIVHDKSSLARLGLAVQNTVLEPGWNGYVTLEVSNHTDYAFNFVRGCAIAQVVFHFLDHPTILPYDGKYQNQKRGPQEAK